MEDNVIDRLKEYKEKIQNRIEKEMHNLVPKFKEYVRNDHPEYPKHILIEGMIKTKTNMSNLLHWM